MVNTQSHSDFDNVMNIAPGNNNLKSRNEVPRRDGTDRRCACIETRLTQNNCYIFRERETAQNAFVIVSGTVEIVKNTDDGEVVIGRLGKGAIFGEMALIDDMERMASARAIGAVTVDVITREMINRQIAHSSPFVIGLIKVLSDHVRMTAKILGGTVA